MKRFYLANAQNYLWWLFIIYGDADDHDDGNQPTSTEVPQPRDAWFEKPLHGRQPSYFLNDNVDKQQWNLWLKLGHFQAEPEGDHRLYRKPTYLH